MYVVCISGLSIIGFLFVVSNVYLLSLSRVLCIQCCMCLWIVHYWFPLRLSLTFGYCLYIVSCVCCMCLWIAHYWVPLRLSLTFTYCLYTVSCVCCMCLWIAHYWVPLRFSLTFTYFLCPVSCVFHVICVSGLSIIGFLFGCLKRLLIIFVPCLVYPMLYVSLDCPLLVSTSVVSNVYLFFLSCVLCIQCCMCLWIFHYWFPLRLSLAFTYCLCPVSCVFNIVCVSGLSIIDFLFGCL